MRAVSRFPGCVAALALLLAIPLDASAASRTKRRSTRTAPSTSAPAPAETDEATTSATTQAAAAEPARAAPASSAPVASTQLTSAGSAPSAMSAGSSLTEGPAETPKYLLGLGVGPSWPIGSDIGFEVSARGLFHVPAKAGKATLWFVLPLRVNRWTMQPSVTLPGTGFPGFGFPGAVVSGPKASVLAFALVPTLQASGVVAPRLRGYASFGIGVAHGRITVDQQYLGPQTTGRTDMEFDLTCGAEYTIDDRYSLIVEPIAPRYVTSGTGLGFVWTALVGVNAKL